MLGIAWAVAVEEEEAAALLVLTRCCWLPLYLPAKTTEIVLIIKIIMMMVNKNETQHRILLFVCLTASTSTACSLTQVSVVESCGNRTRDTIVVVFV